MKQLVLLCILVGCCYTVFPQRNKIDSLRALLPHSSTDTARIDIFLELAQIYRRVSLDSIYYYGNVARELSIRNGDKKREAKASLLIGMSHLRRGNLTEGLNFCQLALNLSVEHNLRATEAEALNNIGLIHNYQADYPLALQYYQKALAIAEPLNDIPVIANILNNIGGIYYNLKDFKPALEYWNRVFELQRQFGDTAAAANCLNNIGMVYADQGAHKVSLGYYFLALKMFDPAIACSRIYPLENIGNLYLKIGKLDSAEFYLKQALEGAEHCNNPVIKIGVLTSLADVCKGTGRHQNALAYLKEGYEIGTRSGLTRETGIVAKSLSELYERLGNAGEALVIFKTYHAIQDSIYNNDNVKTIGRLEAQYEYELDKRAKEAERRIENMEKERLLARQRRIGYSFIGGFVVMLFVALMFYRNFRRKKMSNLRLEMLNNEIRAQQVELISQAEQLKQLNESLSALNNDLELKIAERTQELRDKNTELENKNMKLANYAFINAHKLRAPVASILGLAALFENKNVDNLERGEIVDKIKGCAEELNGIVREIRMTLEKEKSPD